MARILRWSRSFVEEMEQAIRFIERNSKIQALRFAENIFDIAKSLERHPETGHRVEDLGDDALRQRLVGSYRVIYEFDDDHVHLLRFIHASRDLGTAWESEGRP
jgi:toxin ParE1/3/4